MGYKCTPQLLGLTNGEPPVKTNSKTGKKYKNRHRANGEAIAKEMFPERASKSKTLDRSRSHLNTYEGFTTGEECWAAMMDDVEAYRMPVKLRNGETAYRRLSAKMKEELVPGWSIIINPPPEMTVGWSDADYDRFDADSMDVLAELCPIFRQKNVRGKAIHRDEGREDANGEFGRNTHWIGDSLDDEGRYCGSIIDGDLYDLINRQYPAMMRDRGWDLDDLDVTDWQKYKDDPEYKAERDKKRRNQGRDVNQVISDERHAARLEVAMERHEANELRVQNEMLEERAGTILADAMERATEITTEAVRDARAIRREADQDRDAARRDRNAAFVDAQDAEEYAEQVMDDADEYARTTRKQANRDADKVRQDAAQDADATRKAADQYAARIRQEADRDAQAVRLQVAAMRDERDEAQADRDRAITARKTAVAALQGDYETWARLTPRPSAKALLGVLGAAIEASHKTEPEKPTSQLAGTYARMMAMMQARQSQGRQAQDEHGGLGS